MATPAITVHTPILLAVATAALLTLAPTAGAEDCDRAGVAPACAPSGHSSVVSNRTTQEAEHARESNEAGYWPFHAQSGDRPAPEWVME